MDQKSLANELRIKRPQISQADLGIFARQLRQLGVKLPDRITAGALPHILIGGICGLFDFQSLGNRLRNYLVNPTTLLTWKLGFTLNVAAAKLSAPYAAVF
jgi:hypothetical protein